jgi:hypothetical protein
MRCVWCMVSAMLRTGLCMPISAGNSGLEIQGPIYTSHCPDPMCSCRAGPQTQTAFRAHLSIAARMHARGVCMRRGKCVCVCDNSTMCV